MEVWNDKGSGADEDVKLWKPICGIGYKSVGYAATSGARPKHGAIYCVKNEHVIYGSNDDWRKIWTDRGSGADKDVTVYEAHSTKSNLQNIRAFGAIARYHGTPGTPYFLKTSSFN